MEKFWLDLGKSEQIPKKLPEIKRYLAGNRKFMPEKHFVFILTRQLKPSQKFIS